MGESNKGCYEPSCLLAHDLNNKLAIILGYCDQLIRESEPFSRTAARLGIISQEAHCMAKKLKEHQCKLSEASRKNAEEHKSKSWPLSFPGGNVESY